MKKSTDSECESPRLPQLEKFIESARELECDEDKDAFKPKLRQVVKAKPPKPAPKE